MDKLILDAPTGLRVKQKIVAVVNVFETGSPEGDYAAISIYGDGKDRTEQITYGRSQTTEQGNLGALIGAYVEAAGAYSDHFKPYLSKIGRISLVADKQFIKLLRLAGADPVMKATQDRFFDQTYYFPALAWQEAEGFTEPLSLLVIYDSWIQSGGILARLRKNFPEKTPKNGGDEKKWIGAYVSARQEWLASNHNPILRKTVYRTQCFIVLIRQKNWDLSQPVLANGVIVR